jgi:hypothetical protein
VEQDGQSLELVFEYKASNEGFQNPACWLVCKFHSHKRHRFELAAQSRANGRFGAGAQQLRRPYPLVARVITTSDTQPPHLVLQGCSFESEGLRSSAITSYFS